MGRWANLAFWRMASLLMDTLDRKVVKDKVRNCSRKEQEEVVREALQASSVSGFDKVLRVRSKVTPLALEPCWLLGTATSPYIST